MLTPHPLSARDEPFDGSICGRRAKSRRAPRASATGRTLFLSIHQIATRAACAIASCSSAAAASAAKARRLNGARPSANAPSPAHLSNLEDIFLALT
jgi:hypothetical protein